MECGKFEQHIRLAMLDCADKDSELFCAIDTSGVLALPRFDKRILKLIRQSTKAGVNRFNYKRRRAYKLIGVIAAVLMILYLSVSVYAGTKGMSEAEFIKKHVGKWFNMVVGETIEGDGITLIKGEASAEYASLDEAIEKSGWNILYPTALPEGVKITFVQQVAMGEDDYLISFKTNSNSVFINITTQLTDKIHFEGYDAYEINNHTFYILTKESFYIGRYQENGLEYYIQCDNKDDLMLIIDNIKKLS